jgi:hypothetical protein
MKPTDSRSAFRLARILDILLEGDLDTKQLAERLCMADPRQVAKYLRHLRKSNKLHISGWRPPGVNGHRWPIWRFGGGANKPKPAPKTAAEVMRDYWRRQGRGLPKDPPHVACPFGALFKLQEQRA